MTHDEKVGLILWIILTLPVWWPGAIKHRRNLRRLKADGVSGNETGPLWEQDRVWDEVFERDDLDG